MYIITADQIDSRHQDDLAGAAVDELNAKYGGRIALPVDRNAGDEIQALAADAATALEIIADLTRTGRWSVGCGVGHVRAPLPANTREASGPGFIAARAAVERAKGMPLRFALESEASPDTQSAEALIELLLLIRSRRTAEGWELFDLVSNGLTQSAAAKALGITPQAASQRARTAAIRSEIAAMPALADVLSRLDVEDGEDGGGEVS
ncbi:MAG: DNA-binding protein [Micrococcales bacterium 70-64]|nr:DNA-binding protein [Leifsonia sp.]ODU65624.1 MAG: DNA-binding protein [Leifsonia sp. SCN 70-46]OJX84251.1 MAG: DNA-binding protein [Micrococcales bacterium 70-64]